MPAVRFYFIALATLGLVSWSSFRDAGRLAGHRRNQFCLGWLPFSSINHRSANHHCAIGHQHNAAITVKRIIVWLVLASVLRRVVILLGTTSKAQSRESY